MVTFYRGHCRTLCCLPGIISLIIMCIGIIFAKLLFRRRTCLTGLRLGLNSKPRPLHMAPKWLDHWTTRAGCHRHISSTENYFYIFLSIILFSSSCVIALSNTLIKTVTCDIVRTMIVNNFWHQLTCFLTTNMSAFGFCQTACKM